MNNKQVNYLHYIVLSFMALTFLLPLVWLVAASLDPNASDALKTPAAWTMGNFVSVLTEKSNLRAYWVGFVISFVESLAVVLLSCLAAYPLSKLSYKKAFMNIILFMTALPMIAVIVPVYKMYLSLGLLDKIWGVILYLSASSLPYGLWLMKNFMDAVPQELEEAACIDGCGPFQCFIQILLPLLKPALFSAGLFQFLWTWNDFFNTNIYINTVSKFPLSLALRVSIDVTSNIQWNQVMSMALVSVIPLILLFFAAQKYFVEGIATSGLKG